MINSLNLNKYHVLFSHKIFRGLGLMLYCLIGLINFQSANAQSFLKADGTRIVDESGQNFLIRGMGLGGWMLQEGYMFKLNQFGRQYKIKEAIHQLVGPE